MINKKIILGFLLILISGLFCVIALKCKLSGIQYAIRSISNQIKVYMYSDELVRRSERVFWDTFDQVNLAWDKGEIVHNWNYCNGIMMLAFLKTGHRRFVERFYNDNIYDDGTVNNRKNRHNFYVRGALDDILPARTLFYLLDNSANADKYKANIKWIYHNELSQQPVLENLGGNFVHKINNRAWVKYPFGLDGIYMSLPFWIEYEHYLYGTTTKKTTDEIFKRLDWLYKNLRTNNGLYYHGCQSDGKSNNGYVWTRGLGWFAMGQVDVLKLYPEGEKKEILKQHLKELFDSMIAEQDKETGLWYNMLYPKDINFGCNKLETSGSSMMAYSMMSAYLNDLVTDKKYAFAGLKAFNGVVENNLHNSFLHGHQLDNIYKVAIIYDGEDAKRYYDCSLYVTDDPKGSAPLILASTLVGKTIVKLYLKEYR